MNNTKDSPGQPQVGSTDLLAKYPANCWTLEEAIEKIKIIFNGLPIMVERFNIETVTDQGNKLKLKFDRKNVGQPKEVITEPLR